MTARPPRAATRALEVAGRAGIGFSVHTYGYDPDAEAIGEHVASALGLDPRAVFKTLVAKAEGSGLVVALVPVRARLDLKAVARAAGGKRAEMAPPAEAERATGYVVGAISPLGQKRRLLTVLDASAEAFSTIYVSAGRRGLELELAPGDLLALTGGRYAAITTGD